jgi:hypothetical protein
MLKTFEKSYISVSLTNSKYPINATSLLVFGTKIPDDDQKIQLRKLYKIKFFGINFLAILDNFCSENSSLLLK